MRTFWQFLESQGAAIPVDFQAFNQLSNGGYRMMYDTGNGGTNFTKKIVDVRLTGSGYEVTTEGGDKFLINMTSREMDQWKAKPGFLPQQQPTSSPDDTAVIPPPPPKSAPADRPVIIPDEKLLNNRDLFRTFIPGTRTRMA